MSTGARLFIIAAGAILLFAVPPQASPDWLNLHTVGIILMIMGLAGLILPRLMTRSSPSEFRRWVVPMLPGAKEQDATGQAGLTRRPGDSSDSPTLADDLLRDEDPPRIEPDGSRQPPAGAGGPGR